MIRSSERCAAELRRETKSNRRCPPPPQRREGTVLDGRVPTVAGVALLGSHEFAHDEFPVAGGCGGIPGLLVDAGQLEAEGGGGVRLVARGDEPVGLSLFAGVEGLLFLGFEILDIVGAPPRRKTR